MDGMDPPSSVRRSAVAWAVAVACGVLESALAVVQASSQQVFGLEMLAQLGVRTLVYLLAAVLIGYFRQGRRWARGCLAVLLTGLGLASLLVPAMTAVLDGQAFLQAFGGGDLLGRIFVPVRLVHVVCVLGASVLMFTASANRYFAVAPRFPPATASRN